MKEYIEREAALEIVKRTSGDYATAWCNIRDLPATDVAPVVLGKWIHMDAHKGMENFKCSVCRSECYVPTCMGEPLYGYCPHCGAKMDKERERE